MIWYKTLIFFVCSLVLPGFVFAAGGGTTTVGLVNPLGATTDLSALILKIVEGVAQIGYYVVVLFIIYSGFKFVTARGNDTKLKEAKQTFLFTVIGAAILLGATLLAKVIDGTVTQLKTSSAEHLIVPPNNV